MKIALDWTPNPIHCGILHAYTQGWFADENIRVELISPSIDNYRTTPRERLNNGEVELAIVPPEAIAQDRLEEHNQLLPLRSLLQGNTSAIATLKTSDIKSPKDLDGKTYAALELPWEIETIRAMIIADGGQGNFNPIIPPKLDIYNLLFSKAVDFVWLFEPIEAVEAQFRGLELNLFHLEDYAIPYGSTTVLATTHAAWQSNQKEIETALAIIARGYKAVAEAPELGLIALEHFADKAQTDPELIRACQFEVNKHTLSSGEWGFFDEQKMQTYIDWIRIHCFKTSAPIGELERSMN